MPFKAYLSTNNGASFATNALSFATKEEAEAYLHDLTMRWLAPTDWEVRESADAVNYRWTDIGAVPILEELA